MIGNPTIRNAITIDLEDWIQSVYDHSRPLTELFVRNTHRVLDLLDSRGVRATFFVLGLAAEKAPSLIRELAARGHDVQSHGFSHVPVHRQTAAQFTEDITRSKRMLEDLIGAEVTAYRAPVFSIVRSSLWALNLLAESGFTIDSSIFPVRMRRYGIRGTSIGPYFVRTSHARRLLEAPVAAIQHGPLRLPAGGGGYFRLLPYGLIRHCIRSLNNRGLPATVYLHPYEFAPEEFDELPVRVPLKVRMHQGLGRGGMARKLGRMLDDLAFGTLAELTASRTDWPTLTLEPETDPQTAHGRVGSLAT